MSLMHQHNKKCFKQKGDMIFYGNTYYASNNTDAMKYKIGEG